jgi:mRNA interferase ChpB
MEVILKKMGNSTALVLPPPVLRDLGIAVGQNVPLDLSLGHAGCAITLAGAGCKTQGVALMNKIRMLDLAARQAHKLERVPKTVVDDALACLTALIS